MSKNGREPVGITREWAKGFPHEPGVYAVFENDELIYTGEAGCIAARMTDLVTPRRHVLRRSIGNDRFSHVKGFKRATRDHPFPPRIEKCVDNYVNRLTVRAIVVPFGRTEVQEYMIRKYKPIYNTVGR